MFKAVSGDVSSSSPVRAFLPALGVLLFVALGAAGLYYAVQTGQVGPTGVRLGLKLLVLGTLSSIGLAARG